MIEDKDVHIQVDSEVDGYTLKVLNPECDRTLFYKYWEHNDVGLGVGGEVNFIELLKFLGYTVCHEEFY